MSLIGDIIDRVLFPNREIHVIPVLDGAFSPNQRLDQSRRLGGEIERPDDLALGPDGALYVSSAASILRCTGVDYRGAQPVRDFACAGRRSCVYARRALAGLRLKHRARRPFARRGSVGQARPRAGRSDRLPAFGGRRARRDDLSDRGLARKRAGELARRSHAEPSPLRASHLLQRRAGGCARAGRQARLALGRSRLARWRRSVGRRGLEPPLDRIFSRRRRPALAREELRRLSRADRSRRGSRLLDGLLRPAHAAYGIRIARARVLRGNDAQCGAGALDRSDSGRSFQLSRADADRPHKEARHPEALGAGALLWSRRSV